MTDLGTLPGFSSTTAFHINEAGQIVGGADNFVPSNDTLDTGETNSLPIEHAFLWDNGHMSDMNDPLNEFTATQANDINNKGEIVGTMTLRRSKLRGI